MTAHIETRAGNKNTDTPETDFKLKYHSLVSP